MTEKHSETLKTVINEFAGKTISNQEIELLSSIGIKKMLKPKIYFEKNPNAYMSPMKQTDHITNFKKSEATLKKVSHPDWLDNITPQVVLLHHDTSRHRPTLLLFKG